jgi:uncharacterized protein (TIGR02001 family)
MKTMAKSLLCGALLAASAVAQAGLSANIGGMSDYWFRGLDQTSNNASIMGGVDYEHDSGLYVGTWLASLPSDLEYDLYAGYAGEYGDFSYSAGVTGYFYQDYEGDYTELNLSVGYGPVTLSHNIGKLDDPAGDVDYSFTSITGEYEGAYLTYGFYGDEVDGSYAEVGYGLTFEGIDFNVAAIFPDEDVSATNNWVSSSNELLFTFSKSFDL